MNEQILREVSEYYAGKIREFGPTPLGVDWNGTQSQQLRFAQLVRIFDKSGGPFSVLDYGCGYGALMDYIKERQVPFSYTGYDVCRDMSEAGAALHHDNTSRWVSEPSQLVPHDFTIASGIFNVKGNSAAAQWNEYISDTIYDMARLSTKGLAFNMLSSYSDPEKRKAYLHYAEPSLWFDFCKTKIARKVSLCHDYDLYEFSILVHK